MNAKVMKEFVEQKQQGLTAEYVVGTISSDDAYFTFTQKPKLVIVTRIIYSQRDYYSDSLIISKFTESMIRYTVVWNVSAEITNLHGEYKTIYWESSKKQLRISDYYASAVSAIAFF